MARVAPPPQPGTFLLSLAIAGYYFAYLAHESHPGVRTDGSDWATSQLLNTVDLRTPSPCLALFLDRQRLHHLFPTVDHTRLHTRRQNVAPRPGVMGREDDEGAHDKAA